MTIEDITISDYFTLKDSSGYDIFIDCLRPSDTFCGKKCRLDLLTFDEVNYLKSVFKNINIELLQEVFVELFNLGTYEKSGVEVFMGASVFDLFRCKSYIEEYLLEIIQRENNLYSGFTDENLSKVNASERLKGLDHILTKINLAEQFGCMPDDIGNMRYSKVFNIIIANKRYNDVKSDYEKSIKK